MGGAEHSLADILAAVAPRCRCHLITTEDGELAERAARAGVSCHVVPCATSGRVFLRDRLLSTLFFSFGDVLSFLGYVRRLRRCIAALRPGLVHANVPKAHVALFLIALTGYKGKCCYHVRELFTPHSAASWLYRVLYPKQSGMVIAISAAVQQSLPPAMRRASTVLYNGVAIAPRSGFRDKAAPLRFLYLGRIVPWKGCHILVDIIGEMKIRHPGAACELSLVGETAYWSQDYRLDLEKRIAAKGLHSCCRLLPATTEVTAVMHAHDVFVNASYREPFGRSIAEAQGAGLPVVSFDSGGVAEIVEHGVTGFLVPYGDIGAFVEALDSFADHPERVRVMGDKANARAKLLFNREIQVPKIADCLLRNA
jgi:glycosyltransferase involved in cell wall biosynthesis